MVAGFGLSASAVFSAFFSSFSGPLAASTFFSGFLISTGIIALTKRSGSSSRASSRSSGIGWQAMKVAPEKWMKIEMPRIRKKN